MKIRRLDYIISFVLIFLMVFLNLVPPVGIEHIISCLTVALVGSLIIGTITNLIYLIFKKLSS
jgi:hypothetical protein